MHRYRLVTAILALVAAATGAAAQSSAPCRSDERRAELDFWVGSWRVVDREGRTVGTSRVEKRQQGCLIGEAWSSASGGGGESINFFDPAAGLWKQHWVDQAGSVVHYAGRVEDGVLRFEGQHVAADGTVTTARSRLEPVAGGRLHHLIEHSSDGGRTWSVYFDGTYLPLGGQLVAAGSPRSAAPAPPSVAPEAVPEGTASEPETKPEPEPETSREPMPAAVEEPVREEAARPAGGEGREVRAVSRALEREEIPAEQVPELRMASPMVLEIVPGPVDRLPENTAWQTDETKGFMCNETIVEKVLMSRRDRGDQVEIEIGVRLYTPKRSRRAELQLELLSGERVIASQTLSGIRLGLNIPAHGKEGLLVTSEMTISRSEFEQLFAAGADRALRLTLTVP